MVDQTELSKKLQCPTLSRSLAAMAVSALLLAGCSGVGLKTQAHVLSENANTYVAANPDLSSSVKNDIQHHRLRKGMSKRDVAAAWGRLVMVRNYSQGGSEY